MYVPHFNRVDDDDQARAFVDQIGVATLITAGTDGVPDATLLPVDWQQGRVVAHFARANEHWRRIVDGGPALLVVQGIDAYVSPGWYASKAEHGRVVPTWNYSAVQLRGPVTVHDDPDWTRAVVDSLTNRREAFRDQPWHVDDAPEKYVEGQLRAIVGVELTVETVDAKAKWSQNRSDEDRAGVRAAYEQAGADEAAARMTTGGL